EGPRRVRERPYRHVLAQDGRPDRAGAGVRARGRDLRAGAERPGRRRRAGGGHSPAGQRPLSAGRAVSRRAGAGRGGAGQYGVAAVPGEPAGCAVGARVRTKIGSAAAAWLCGHRRHAAGTSIIGGMRFEILGPTEVLGDDGTGVPVGGPRVRALLALLALEPGRVIGAGRLVSGLYGAEPPDGVANALQSQV